MLLTVAGAAAGVVAAYSTSETWSARAQLNVGTADAEAQAVPGYVQAAQSLASSYSRVALTSDVLTGVARQVGLTPQQVNARLVVTPVLDNPLLTVKATGGTEQQALALAQAETEALVSTVSRITRESDGSDGRLLADYRRAAARAAAAQSRLQRLKDGSGSGAKERAAEVEVNTLQLQAQTAAGLYTQARQNRQQAAGLQVVDRPRSTGSDRMKTVQKLVFAGAAAGLVIALCLAALLERRRTRRRS